MEDYDLELVLHKIQSLENEIAALKEASSNRVIFVSKSRSFGVTVQVSEAREATT